ncbi:diacylglycerol/lipid kinase family protein [Carnobacterium gallinarum]|uniref:diacylglycerol/lipid kinase family protein n=1 Tax=Carnobacterium gallinarum TaxID=2749 RepID=UPI00054EFC05|nr:diacylglycerol kinase family protein [Carnobacterium gallinarum]
MKKTNYYFIINEYSGSGNGKKVWQLLENYLQSTTLSYFSSKSTYAGETIKLVHQLASKINAETDLIVVVGGDGTLHEAIQGLAEEFATLPLGYIPAGSGNDFARGVGISKKPLEALKQILNTTHSKKLDVLFHQEKKQGTLGYAVNNVGIGFDALIVKLTNNSSSKVILNKYNLGSLAYLASLIRAYFTQPAFPIFIEVDGKKQRINQAFLVTTTNHAYFGGGVKIAPMAKPDDGIIDVIILSKLPILKIAFLFLCMMLGGLHTHFKSVKHFSGRSIHIQTLNAEDGQADGEELGRQVYDSHFSTVSRNFWF